MLALLLFGTAHAEDLAYNPELPIEWWIDGSPTCCASDEEVAEELGAAWAEWQAAAPCAISSTFMGHADGLTAGQSGFAFGEGAELSVAATSTDVALNLGADNAWATEAAITGGSCTNAWSLHHYGVQLIGSAFGAWDFEDIEYIETCTSGVDGISDDAADRLIATLSLRNTHANWRCSHELLPDDPNTIAVGSVPFNLACASNPVGAVPVRTEWDFGDGGTSDQLDPDHEYTEPGTYSIEACHTWETETCGEQTRCTIREAYVVACAPAEALFTVEHDRALTWTLLNETDLDTGYGCISSAQWDVFDEEGERVWTSPAWQSDITFPEPGTYRVVLNVGGFAGTAASELFVEVGKSGSPGCNSSGTPALFWVSALVLLFRRRKTVQALHRLAR